MSINIRTYIGVYDDPKFENYPILYGLGSYVPHAMPDTFKYIYLIIYNGTKKPCKIENVWAENTQKYQIHNLDIPENDLKNIEIAPKSHFLLAFSQHLLTRCLSWGGLSGAQDIYFQLNCNDATTYKSDIIHFDLDNSPAGPLEDMELLPYAHFFLERAQRYAQEKERILKKYNSLYEYADIHTFWGIFEQNGPDGPEWILREYMPQASAIWLTTDKLKFQRWASHAFNPIPEHAGWWELRLPKDALEHGTYLEFCMQSHAEPGLHRRIPAMAKLVIQDERVGTQWCARHWAPTNTYEWKHEIPKKLTFPRIYEAHIGMAQDSEKAKQKQKDALNPEKITGNFQEFTNEMLPRIRDDGYTHIQLMGVIEHPLYKSYGYQVSSYFATSSRFGDPNDFKKLVDTAHGYGLRIILDIPHSHTLPNTEQGIARYDGSHFFFSQKSNQWGTISFNYEDEMARRFLLANCRFWLEEFKIDGFRFDAVGNMLYNDHGHDDDFNHVGRCFYGKDGTARADEYGQLYLALANDLIHEMRPDAESIAEEFSGMPGLTSAPNMGGFGFDYRFAMGIPDFWGKFIKDEDKRDMGTLWHEMTNHRSYDRTISYVECHDQCINGKDAMIWRILGEDMYTQMSIFQQSWKISRGIALYKLMRMLTLSTAHYGYLNFMGAEFGHPEWLDEDGYGHRQWHLATNPDLRYAHLAAFDKSCMIEIVQNYAESFAAQAIFRHIHEEHKTLAFERGSLLMVFNFHETQSQSDLEIFVTPGKYIEILSTDRVIFGGHGNVDAYGTEHFSHSGSGVNLQCVKLYLPPMTALILLRQ